MTPENDQPAAPPPDGDPPRSEQPLSEQPPEPALPSDDTVVASTADEAAGSPAAEELAPVPPPRRGRSGAALVGAAILGAVIALAGFVLVSPFVPRDDASALDARLAAIELQLRDLASSVPPASPPAADTRALDEMAGRLAKLEAAAGAAGPASAGGADLENRLAGLEGEVKALNDTIAALGRRSDETVAAAREARTRAETTAAALAALTQKVADAPAVARKELEGFDQRVAALERGGKALQGELAKRSAAESGDRAVQLALAATALNAAVERGEPFAPELATAKALAADPKALAPLEPFAASGVPGAATLARELAQLAPSLRPAAPAPREGFLQRLQRNAEKLVRVNPVEEPAGNDASAVVGRIEVKAGQGDLAGALAELTKLPPAERAAAEPWIKKVQARMAAIEASRRFAAGAQAGLGK